MGKKVSVLLTTYNGGKYILKQIESIWNQTRKPDEVIICDDGSSDDTIKIIDQFVKDKKLSNWRIFQNEKNLGWRANFFYGSSLVTGDILFFSDQDDIWHKDKIEIMSSLFEQYEMDALYCERNIIDENGDELPGRKEKNHHERRLERISCSESFYTVKALGCCECVSRKVIDLYHQINLPECGHDSQCARIALLYGTLWHYRDPLIDYRIHGLNNSGVSKAGSFGHSRLSTRIKDLENDVIWMNRNIILKKIPAKHTKHVMVGLESAKIRLAYLTKEEKVSFISLLRSRKGYPNITSLIGDFAYRHKLNLWFGKVRWTINQRLGI